MTSVRSSGATGVAAVIGMAFVGLGCGSASEPPPPPSGGTGAQVGAGGTAAPGAGGATAGAGNSNPGGFGFQEPAAGGNGGLPEDTCGALAIKAEKIVTIETEVITDTVTTTTPAALYIMQDQSGSMIDKWFYALDAITQFANDPNSAGIDVGIQYFPISGPFCIPLDIGGDCTGGLYATPEVPFATLQTPGAGHNQALIENFTSHAPCGAGTPIEGALRGVVQGCQTFEQANAGTDCYGVLVTDGAPADCSADPAVLSGIAADAAPGVKLFTVGMPGTDFNLMDQIATASGTDCNGDGTPGRTCNANNAAEFAAALATIRETVTEVIEMTIEREVETTVPLDCEWEMPTAQTEEELDLNEVNVQLTDVGTGTVTELGKVPSAAECANFQNGWYYDNPEAPARLIACDDVCGVVKSIEAKIDILVGCDSKPAVPR